MNDDIRDYLYAYLINTKNRVDEYITTNYYSIDVINNYNIRCMYNVAIKRFNKDIAVECIKVLSFHDVDDDEPTYYLEYITPNFFLTPYQFLVKVKIYIEEQIDIPTFKIFKVDECVICLNNKPEIMFYDCLHCCVCSDCDKVKPLMKCPYCRKEIIAKIII